MFHTFFRRPIRHTFHQFIRYTHTHTRTFTSTTKRLFEWYSDVLDRRPYTTQMATSGFLGGMFYNAYYMCIRWKAMKYSYIHSNMITLL